MVRIAVLALMLVVRLALALAGAGLTAFLVVYLLEAVIASGAIVFTYYRSPESPGLQAPSLLASVALLRQSWPLLVAGVARQVNLRADLVLLQAMLGSAPVGIYSAATRLSEVTYILPVVFTNATFPALLAVRGKHGPDSAGYDKSLQRSYDTACWVGAGVAAATFLAGPFLITTVFGERYVAAGSVLRIHVLALPFVFMAAVLAKWQVAEGLLRQALLLQVVGALVNIALNVVLIPRFGLHGAALATVASYTASSYLLCFVGEGSLRRAGIQMTIALLLPWRLLQRAWRSRRARQVAVPSPANASKP